MRYRPEIDGLRAIAVIPVILFHAGFELFSGGFIGVDVFFVISGYLITTIIISEMERGCFSLKKFYERRARRILPALFFVMAFTVPFAWMWLPPEELKSFWKSVAAVSTFSSNFLFLQESGYFDTETELKPLLHTWSLAVEEQYYILFPLFIMSTWRFGKSKIILSLVLFFVASLSVAQWAAYKHPDAAFYLLPTRGWEILLGAFSAFIFNHKKKLAVSHITEQILGLTGLALIFYSIFVFDSDTPFPGFYALVPTVGTLLIILFAKKNTLAAKLLSNNLVVGVGLISYSAYLWHQPLFALSRHSIPTDISTSLMISLCFVTFVIAYVSWRYVEKPFRRKEADGKTAFSRAAIVLSIVFIGIATSGYTGLTHSVDGEARNIRESLRLDAKKERQRAIKGGTCHYNKKKHSPKVLAEFLSNWACHSNDENLFDSGLLVFGDSHSADKVIALAQNGVDVTQIGAVGCPLVPQGVSVKLSYCKPLFSLAQRQQVKKVLLSHRFGMDQLNQEYLVNIFSYWSQRYNEVILFTPMPNFKHAVYTYIMDGSLTAQPRLSGHNLFKELISTIDVPDNVTIIDTHEILCGSSAKECHVVDNGEWLILDGGHLSVKGAKVFGSRLKASKYGHLFFNKEH